MSAITVAPVHGDVTAHQLRELAAAVRAGKPEEQNRRIATFEDLVGPPAASSPGCLNEEFDVVDQEWISWGAGPVARCGVLASNPGQCCGDEFVRGWRQVAGGAMLMFDRRDARAEGGDGVGPLPRLAPGVGGVDEVGGDGGSGAPATSRDHSTRTS
ncbi:MULTISPECIES: hypothetical protein [unclassified Rhodococcus (in: high G+C Gram-positive bacteria)]|uniref:hypothetical protein n=1 Tax=unclassified Rhodococcus (in: high G+C Gram-positive bacteria) TaxID=192944 RepID=UPI0015C5C3DD